MPLIRLKEVGVWIVNLGFNKDKVTPTTSHKKKWLFSQSLCFTLLCLRHTVPLETITTSGCGKTASKMCAMDAVRMQRRRVQWMQYNDATETWENLTMTASGQHQLHLKDAQSWNIIAYHNNNLLWWENYKLLAKVFILIAHHLQITQRSITRKK